MVYVALQVLLCPVRDGLIFGHGKAIHAHGTVSELEDSIPKPFKLRLPDNFKGI